MDKKLGYMAVLASSVCFGFLGYFGKIGYKLGYTPLSLLTVRFTLAAILLWIVAIVRGRHLYRAPRKDMLVLVAQGVAYACTALGFFNALRYLPASLASIIFYVHPILTIAAATFLFKERLTLPKCIAVMLAVLGTALISAPGGSGSGFQLTGFLWITFGAASYSVFTLIGQKTTQAAEPFVVTTYSITFCALTLILLNPPLYMLDGSLSAPMWAVGVGIGFISSVLAILLYVVGIKAIGAARTSIVSAAEPVSAVILAALLLGERLVGPQWIGMFLILLAVGTLQFESPKITSMQDSSAQIAK